MVLHHPVLKLCFASRTLVKTMSTFGIQTNQGILQLSKRVQNPPPSTKDDHPEAEANDIDILIPKKDASVFEKLRLLHSFNEACQNNGISSCNGFHTNGTQFDKVICLCDSEEAIVSKLDLKGFNKISFHRKATGYVLKHTVGGDEYTLKRFSSHHPIVESADYKPVYSSYKQVLPALGLIAANNSTLSLTPLKKQVDSIDKNLLHSGHPLTHPFIVVEGLDGTGKSTLSKNLAKHLNGIQMGTPPPSISGIRGHFDNFPQLYRRSYYALGNYIAAQEVLGHCATQAVVMDRFWHSTTAYAIATEVGCGTSQYLPPAGHEIFNWPSDLLYPSAVVFLTTPEKDRDLRVNERDEQTSEEKYISESRTFRARITETYRRIGHTKWMEVDTSGTQQETLDKVVAALKLHQVID